MIIVTSMRNQDQLYFGNIYSESMALESDFKFAHCAQRPKAEAPVLLSDGLEMKLPSST